MMTIRAHYDGKVFVPDEPVKLDVGLEVVIAVSSQAPVTPAPRKFQPLPIRLSSEDVRAIAEDPEFDIENS